MKHVVLIPVWQRPEFFATTLVKLTGAFDWRDQYYTIRLDKDYDPANLLVFSDASCFETLGPIPGCIHSSRTRRGLGNSDNILSGLEHAFALAASMNARRIHILEEDVWVNKDYFSFHEKIHEQFGHPFAISACRNQSLRIDPPYKPESVYKSRDYQSLGVSFSMDAVREILIHNVDEYFDDMIGYLQIMFPHSRYGKLFEEQDGLIARIIEAGNHDVIYPYVPRAFHAGFYSYHRDGKRPAGTLNEKITALQVMSEQEMNDRSTYKDIRFAPSYQEVSEFILDAVQ